MSTIINIDLPEWIQDKAWIEKLLVRLVIVYLVGTDQGMI
jgi:hypothetical protein